MFRGGGNNQRVDACLGICLRFGDSMTSSPGTTVEVADACSQAEAEVQERVQGESASNVTALAVLPTQVPTKKVWRVTTSQSTGHNLDVQRYSSDPPLCRLIAKLVCHWEPIPSRYGAISSVVQHASPLVPEPWPLQNHGYTAYRTASSESIPA